MNINKINLNLLKTLGALLTERHVSRAAEKLYLSQSAVSNSLNQLREVFQDELLIRAGVEGMTPTPRALELQPQVHQVLQKINQLIFTDKTFNPNTSNRKFKLGMSDHTEFCILPNLLDILCKHAPDVELSVQHVNQLNGNEPLQNGELDLVIGCLFSDSANLVTEDLFDIKGVVAARKSHPLMQKRMTLKQYLSAKHLRIQYRQDNEPTNIDKALLALGETRDVTLSIPHVLPALFSLQHNDLLATIPNFVPDKLARKLNLAIQPIPFKMNLVPTQQTWHRRFDNDPGHQWLREMIKLAINKVSAKGSLIRRR